jgi:hypothetical protein
VKQGEHRQAAMHAETARHVPYRTTDGAANAGALAALSLSLPGLPEPGRLYHVGVRQDPDGAEAEFIGEFLGFVQDRTATATTHGEIALTFAIHEPGPSGGAVGTPDDPYILWPLDVSHLWPADPDPRDLRTPRTQSLEDETSVRRRGRIGRD